MSLRQHPGGLMQQHHRLADLMLALEQATAAFSSDVQRQLGEVLLSQRGGFAKDLRPLARP
ncbi:hypothetical protein D3C75_1351660 [compost metagenome]